MIAFAVNIGNLGPAGLPRFPMAQLLEDLNTVLLARCEPMRVVDFFAQTGNFVLECSVPAGHAAHRIARLLDTPCTVLSVDQVSVATTAARTVPPPAPEPMIRWTAGVVFRVSGSAGAAARWTTRTACFRPLNDFTVLAWKRDQLTSRGRLDSTRRSGGWGAVSSAVARRFGGVWTARAISTLDGVLMRAEMIHEERMRTSGRHNNAVQRPGGSRCSLSGRWPLRWPLDNEGETW